MLDNLPALLAGLGPWGIVIGVGVTLLSQWLRHRINPQPPVNPPAPGPINPEPGPSSTPLLDMLLNALRKRLAPQRSFEDSGDIDPATVVKLLKLLERDADD